MTVYRLWLLLYLRWTSIELNFYDSLIAWVERRQGRIKTQLALLDEAFD